MAASDSNNSDIIAGLPRIQSPCVSICVVDPATRQCTGCFRTLKEIARWSRFTAEERAVVMNELPARKAQFAADASAPDVS
jgi:uncharacterized protein